ncbi:hypothetical protein [Anaeroselena agilis]|uniref:Uncharacterized protein n=1 Tax=Anaeroselena agilis TaxID=3063788 RepID=A0ABU3P3K6_9FIRM|nr:hypothetical protein [Selenomonadales bacterium 4137-cl]
MVMLLTRQITANQLDIMEHHRYAVYYDDLQEGIWVQSLHPNLNNVDLHPITGALRHNPQLAAVLSYDRPDAIITDNGIPILVIERTVEVPSGHNVGQRYGRLVAAAEAGVPSIYFGPYAARKHGGATEGPRYMNLRLFYSLDKVTQVTNIATTTINWPVDQNYEVRQDPAKDQRVREYLILFFQEYERVGLAGLNRAIIDSEFQRRQLNERQEFIRTRVRRPAQYDGPPGSVKLLNTEDARTRYHLPAQSLREFTHVVIYMAGMRYLRSDPYAGMAMLYKYLYIFGEENEIGLVLHFPNITIDMWRNLENSQRKDIRIFRGVADGIIFRDGFLDVAALQPQTTITT